MRYDYTCLTCEERMRNVKGTPLTKEEQEFLLFEVQTSIHTPSEDRQKLATCPRCQSKSTVQLLDGGLAGYVRGNGYLDRKGCLRDMAAYKLTTTDEDGKSNDPYGYMREPGEADDLARRIKNSGKPKKLYFTP